MSPKQKRLLIRIILSLILFVLFEALSISGVFDRALGMPQALYVELACFLVPYLIAGYDVILGAFRSIAKGHGLAENFLMTIATVGAFALVLFPDTDPHMAEGAAVMIFFQIGEFFQSYAVDRTRRSIADMMDISPEFANVMIEGKLEQVDPFELVPDDEFIVLPGERIPLDGIVQDGTSRIDSSALTGESVPRTVNPGDEVLSGCVNLNGRLIVRATKPFEDSTVSRILELVENAAEKKARTESFITRFARVYTPVVVGIAVILAVIPPLLFGQEWPDWVMRGLTFLVVSCPCALVISVPLSFFGGIGGASRLGVLIKGSNYLETLSETETMVFDKTGTLTSGTFAVTEIRPVEGITREELLQVAALAEAYSTHPIAHSIREALEGTIDPDLVTDVEEIGGRGIRATIDGHSVLVGNGKLLGESNIVFESPKEAGTVLLVSIDGSFAGSVIIADAIKPGAAEALAALKAAGVKKTIMLSGDRSEVAHAVADELGIDEVRAELLPQDKVSAFEQLIEQGSGKVAFVGDGINDAPVLMRADIGIAMGALGSDAAIEAADIVLMDDDPASIARAMSVSRKTMRIVWQNIIFAIGIKVAVLILAAFGIANMWMAVFADVGVAIIAILNAMRAMRVGRLR